MAEVNLITDGATMEALLHSPSGPVATMLITRAETFRRAAKAQVAPHRRTGCLEDSIVKRQGELDGELTIWVTADTTGCSKDRRSYALFHHEGTKPHDIWSHKPHHLLVFEKHGETVFVNTTNKPVRHPGTKPNRFFTDNLHLLTGGA